MDNMGKYCLKWNWDEFEANIRESFMKLREEQKLFDVTLATDDGQQIQAHKIVLAAGSEFFNDIFVKTDHNNMLIYLSGIRSAELEHITDYLYNGETFIAQEGLTKFLETAQELKVKGLQDVSDKQMFSRKDKNLSGTEPAAMKARESNRQESMPDVMEEELDDSLDSKYGILIKGDTNNPIPNTNHEIHLQKDQMVEKTEGGWKCKVCGKTSDHRRVILSHTETHIEGVSYICHICSKTCSTRQYLSVHMSNMHTDVFSCDDCEKGGMNRGAYRKHIASQSHKTIHQELFSCDVCEKVAMNREVYRKHNQSQSHRTKSAKKMIFP